MGVTRRIIFPTIRLILWAVIALALVKMAFSGADLSQANDSLVPSAQVNEMHAEVSTATITNSVTVQGSVVSDPATPVKATMAGTVSKLLAAHGQQVEVDTPILEILLETPVEPTITTNPETGEQTVKENKPKVKRETVKAATAGTLTLTALKDQIVSVGDAIGSVAPGTLSVSGTLTPEQQYRLLGAPTEAQVTLKGGPAPFTCTGLKIGAAAQAGAGANQSGSDDGGQAAATGAITCAVPAGVTAFPGLGADLEVVNGTAADAIVVPVTAVQGSVQEGNVWVVLPDGGSEKRAVKLGLTDGENVQITEGLAAGDKVLEFVPVGDTVNLPCDQPGADYATCTA